MKVLIFSFVTIFVYIKRIHDDSLSRMWCHLKRVFVIIKFLGKIGIVFEHTLLVFLVGGFHKIFLYLGSFHLSQKKTFEITRFRGI